VSGDRASASASCRSFRIDALPPSLNRLLHDMRLRMSEPPKWRALVRLAARSIPPYREPVVIRMTFFGARDADNHAKILLDAICAAGLILDDRHPYVHELRLRARKLPDAERWPFTRVELWAAAEDEA
jgi:hypothetical protein